MAATSAQVAGSVSGTPVCQAQLCTAGWEPPERAAGGWDASGAALILDLHTPCSCPAGPEESGGTVAGHLCLPSDHVGFRGESSCALGLSVQCVMDWGTG